MTNARAQKSVSSPSLRERTSLTSSTPSDAILRAMKAPIRESASARECDPLSKDGERGSREPATRVNISVHENFIGIYRSHDRYTLRIARYIYFRDAGLGNF